MKYLEQQNIIHRDLAARNVLAAPDNSDDQEHPVVIKIADFGLSRSLEKEYYKSQNRVIPYKWCSPEVIQHGKFSTKSDVWSFGICLWEVFSFGAIPYKTFSNQEAVEKVESGYRLPAPENTP